VPTDVAPTGQRRARPDDAIGRGGERVASLIALPGASAVAAVLEPALAPFWERVAAIAAAATLLAAAGSGREAESGLDSMLIASAGQRRGGALRGRAERICSQRHRRLVARRLEALVARADRAPNRECFDDDERFSAWLRQIEVEFGLPRVAPATAPVPVSSRPCRRPTPSST
jgi:hypothetical protein